MFSGFPAWSDPSDHDIDIATARVMACDGPMPPQEFAAIYPGSGLITWLAVDQEPQEERLAFLMRYWRGLAAEAGGIPPRRLIDPVALKPILGFLMIVEAERGGYDGVYRLYGSGLGANGAGRDWTGFRVSEVARQVQSPAALLFRACYRAVWQRPRPLYTEHVPPAIQGVGMWRRLILPLVDDAGQVTRVLVGNLPTEQRFLSEREQRTLEAWVRRPV